MGMMDNYGKVTITPAEFQKRIDRVLTRLGMKWSFFAQIMAGLDISIDESLPTLATDGKRVIVNTTFWASCLNSDTEITGMAHELVHVVLEHMWRRGDRHPRLWNVACDFKVNQYLEEEGFVPIEGWLRDKKYDQMSEEQIYAELEKEQKKRKKEKGNGGKPCPDGEQGDGEQDGGDGGDGPKPDFDDIIQPSGSKEEQDKAREKVRSAIIRAFNTYKAQGSVGGLAQYLSDRVTKVKEPWYEHMLRWMTKLTLQETNWRRINRRELERTGVVTADVGSPTVELVVVAVDTSGSVGRRTLDYFGGHINTILGEVRPKKVRIIYCDAAINKITDVEDGEPIQLEAIGGGGTDFRPVFTKVDEIGETPDVLVYLTDTFGDYPKQVPDYPVIWASIYSWERCSQPPFGEFLFIDEGD